jgi:hypothetical protein
MSFNSMVDDGPPKDTSEQDGPPDIQRLRQRYPDTPMPHDYDEESDEIEDTPQPPSKLLEQALLMLFIAIAIAHLWTIWTLRADINIVMQFQQEITHQNKHIAELLHTQHQVKWQIVPHAS